MIVDVEILLHYSFVVIDCAQHLLCPLIRNTGV
jgi:hypothetical protein